MLEFIVATISAMITSLLYTAVYHHHTKYGTLEISSTEEVDKVRLNLDTLEGLSKKKRIVLDVKVLK